MHFSRCCQIKFNIADLVALQKWLLNAYDKELYYWAEADFDLDNKLTIFDLVLMRKALLKSINLPVEVSVTESGRVAGAMIIYKVYCEGENYFLSYQDLTYAQEPQSIVIQISEQEYREIMAQDYDSMIRNMKDPDGPEWSECEFRLELTYSDGFQIKTVSDRMPSVTTKLRNLKDMVSSLTNIISNGGSAEKFREKYLQADVLIVDDIQELAGKEKTQDELVLIFNEFYESGKRSIYYYKPQIICSVKSQSHTLKCRHVRRFHYRSSKCCVFIEGLRIQSDILPFLCVVKT